MFIGIALFVVFLAMVVLMYLGKLPALLALPIMAVLFVAVSGIPFYSTVENMSFANSVVKTVSEIVNVVLAEGSMRLHSAIIVVMFGGMLGQFLSMSGVAEDLIRKVAELGGNRPFILTVVLTIAVSVLFVTLGGLGAIVMVGTVVLPVMLSIGIPPLIVGCIFLLGLSFGGMFNLVNWALYIDVLGMSQEQIMEFVVLYGGVFFIVTGAFIVIEFKKAKISIEGKEIGKIITIILVLATFFGLYELLGISQLVASLTGRPPIFWIRWIVSLGLIVFVVIPPPKEGISVRAFLTPLVPIILVMVFRVSIVSAFIGGLLYILRTTWRKGHLNLLTKSIFEGVNKVVPAIALMIGVGMVLKAVMHPAVSYYIGPLIAGILPRTFIPYVVIFTILAPLSLYRGPLNMWGMGSGLVGIMLSTALLKPAAIMGALMSVGQIQGVSDPTNTHNVWVANYLGLDVQMILKKTLPYVWVLTFFGLIIAGVKYVL